MSTQENSDERLALLPGTLDLLILKTLALGFLGRRGGLDNVLAPAQ